MGAVFVYLLMNQIPNFEELITFKDLSNIPFFSGDKDPIPGGGTPTLVRDLISLLG